MGYEVSGRYSPAPRRINTPKPKYNSIVAGDWQMPRKSGTYNVTVNNYIDSTNVRGWENNAWARLDQNQDSGGGFWDKVSGITGIVGAVTAGIGSLVGTVADLFGIGSKKADKKEDEPPTTQKKDDETPTVEKKDDKTPTTQKKDDETPTVEKKDDKTPATQKKDAERTKAKEETKAKEKAEENPVSKKQDTAREKPSTVNLGADADKINPLADGAEIDDDSNINWDGTATVRDQDNKTKMRDIKGKMKVGKKTDNKYPQTFTISDSSGEYSFKLVGTDKATGKPVYQCTSGPNGAAYSKGNNYVLKDVKNGQPTLEQPSNYAGSGESLKKSNE